MDSACHSHQELYSSQRHILGVTLHDCIHNTEITEHTGPNHQKMQQPIRSCSQAWDDTPAHQTLRRQIKISLGWLPDSTWKRSPGRARSKRLHQIRSDKIPPTDLWATRLNIHHIAFDYHETKANEKRSETKQDS